MLRSNNRQRQVHNFHAKLNRLHGRATRCQNPQCPGISKKFDWALRKGCKYSADPKDYLQLCRSCHVIYDRPAANPATPTHTVYKRVKRWRSRNPQYMTNYMRERRAHFKKAYFNGAIDYDKIPPSYRLFKPVPRMSPVAA